jgi:hypothetical protein
MDAVALVTFPHFPAKTAPAEESRKGRLHEHLRIELKAVAQLPPLKQTEPREDSSASPMAFMLEAACGRCRGRCCRNGGDRAYLDARTLQRVMAEQPARAGETLIDEYLRYVPKRSFAGSCIYHSASGCALPRELRSDTCIRYYCGSLRRTLDVVAAEGGRAVIAVFEHPFRPPRTLLARAPQPPAECPDQASAATPAATSSAGS